MYKRSIGTHEHAFLFSLWSTCAIQINIIIMLLFPPHKLVLEQVYTSDEHHTDWD